MSNMLNNFKFKIMELNEIKQAVNSGKIVCWVNDSYQVIKGKFEYLISCRNGSCIGLTWKNGVTMNGEPKHFYIKTLN